MFLSHQLARMEAEHQSSANGLRISTHIIREVDLPLHAQSPDLSWISNQRKRLQHSHVFKSNGMDGLAVKMVHGPKMFRLHGLSFMGKAWINGISRQTLPNKSTLPSEVHRIDAAGRKDWADRKPRA